MPMNHEDEMVEEDDVSQAAHGPVFPQSSKMRMSLWVDTDVYEAYLAYAARLCRDVAPEMNLALRQYIETLWAQTVDNSQEA